MSTNRIGKAGYKDECYTRREDIDKFMPYFDLSDKIVYCPADSEQSEFVKYFKLPGKCKELIYTWDDYHNHYDLFKKADIIVTNPPFSSWLDMYLNYIENKDYILILQNISCQIFLSRKLNPFIYHFTLRHFLRPNGEIAKVNCKLYTTLDITDKYNFNHKVSYTGKYVYNICNSEYKLKMYNFADIPKSVNDRLFLLPSTYDTHYLNNFPKLRIMPVIFNTYVDENNNSKFKRLLATMDDSVTFDNFQDILNKEYHI